MWNKLFPMCGLDIAAEIGKKAGGKVYKKV